MWLCDCLHEEGLTMKHLFYRVLATLIFFTRLPFWRIADVPREYYERVVPLWPLVGYLTAGAMALVAWLTSGLSPYVSIVLCLMTRVLITGALHEDGFADFCDGFGGGNGRTRILEIMKDSHIVTYGMLGLILYFLLQVGTLSSLRDSFTSISHFVALFFIGDVFCKWVSSTIIWFLPYSRKAEDAKNRLVYSHVTWGEKIISILLGILPMGLLFFVPGIPHLMILASSVASCLTAAILFLHMHRCIQGYTGDCCGATFIITEAVFYFVFEILCNLK